MTEKRLRVLVFIPAYNAESTIVSVLDRIPRSLAERYDVSVVVMDDASSDRTCELAGEHLAGFWCPGEALYHRKNQGYGGNQKAGYLYAMERGFDVVAMVHGDGQYAPECLPRLLEPFNDGEKRPDAVYGSRMMEPGDARRGGMPRYKFLGNKALTHMQNRLLGTRLSEFHSGYRLYWVDSLRHLPLPLNSNGFDFDTEIIIQVVFSGGTIVELPIPTFYGDEICHVNSLKYACNIMRTSLKARVMRMGVFFDPKFYFPGMTVAEHVNPFASSPAARALAAELPEGSSVLLIGCRSFGLAGVLTAKGCTVDEADADADLCAAENIPWDTLDSVVLLGALEEQPRPELYLMMLHQLLRHNENVRLYAGTANVAFLPVRLMLLFGQFSYGRRGTLSLARRRLFTRGSLARALKYSGFAVEKRLDVPAPWARAFGEGLLSRLLVAANRPLARLLPGLFAYQTICRAHLVPGPDTVLHDAVRDAAGKRP
ncbi:MAG: glycosyltransferase family 2 protein [Desulfovibrionaceae bacterium]|nr:glycosyltransferase family 2 protein [Desulfovibrionaceae bacterium]